jgi:hypothetical protein
MKMPKEIREAIEARKKYKTIPQPGSQVGRVNPKA